MTIENKSIADVLELTVSEALAFFAGHDAVQAALKPLADVGLEYLRLGQPVPTLSGGEAQRLKLAGHLVAAAHAARAAAAPAKVTKKRKGLRRLLSALIGRGTKHAVDVPTRKPASENHVVSLR